MNPPPPIEERARWHDKSEVPLEPVPVLAEHRAWNRPDGDIMQHVVWWFNNEWRTYPNTMDYAYVDRWQYLPSPSDTQAEERGRAQAEKQIIEWLREQAKIIVPLGAAILRETADAISRGEHRGG